MKDSLVEQKINDIFDKAEQVYGRSFNRPALYFTEGKAMILAMAYVKSNYINFNPYFMGIALETVLNETVIHEAAHIIAHQLYGCKAFGHSPLWAGVARKLGLEKPQRITLIDFPQKLKPIRY